MAKQATVMTEAEINDQAIIIKADAQLGTIDDNFDLLKVEITNQMAKYAGLEFDDKSIVEAKATRAELNKMITVIEEKRKLIRRKWNDPYVAFEARVKEILAIIQAPMAEIDAQLAEYEERRRAEKQAAIDAEIEIQLAAVPWRPDYVRSIGVQFDPRWLNATMAMNKVILDIDAQIKQIIADGTTIERLSASDMEMQEELLEHYQGSHDLTATMGRMAQINERRERARKAEEEAKAREEARLAAMAEAQAAREAELAARQAAQQEAADAEEEEPELVEPSIGQVPAQTPSIVHGDRPSSVPEAHEAVFKTTFSIEVTRRQTVDLVDYLKVHNIPFQMISNHKIEEA